MSLSAGTCLGAYEILSAIGAGGMGEVYRARDTRLKREVALKILPESFASDPDRLARFQREAEVLASLNHPNIAAIYGVEESDGHHALVMELVEGEDLSQRIARGPIPIDEALSIAKQIAEALEAAHEQGIVHRDLKPANINVRPDGTVKVLDFGLAKLTESNAAGGVPNTLSMSPTITSPALMSGVGVLLGTAAYMSPEQAKGRPADKRADIWAFGCVLYEMLTRTRAFDGEDVHDVLARVLQREPDWGQLPQATTSGVRKLLRLCLVKDRSIRLRDAGDVRILLDEAIAEPPSGASSPTQSPGAFWRTAMWSGATALVVAFIAAIVASNLRTPASSHPAHVVVTLPPNQRLATPGNNASISVSPDGTRLAYAADVAGIRNLYLRGLDDEKPTLLPGTEGALDPFFSPDGQWIGFAANGKLKKISTGGGTPVTLADAPVLRGANWGSDDTIVFAPTPTSPLVRVSSMGGKPQPVTTLDRNRGETSHRNPLFLVGRHAVVFSRNEGLTLAVHDMETGEDKDLVQGDRAVAYAPTGHLVYLDGGRLLAVSLDLERLVITGNPKAILDGVRLPSATGASEDAGAGVVAYVQDVPSRSERRLVWVDRSGNVTPAAAPPRAYMTLSLSPDGRRAALTIQDSNVWIYDLVRGILSPLPVPAGRGGQFPIWTLDGTRVTYRSDDNVGARGNNLGARVIYWAPADGSASPEALFKSTNRIAPRAWTRNGDGLALAYTETSSVSGEDIWLLELKGDRKSRVVVNSPGDQQAPQFSPDGRWLAYTSSESGRSEVFIQPFPGPGPRVQVSASGGDVPLWARNGRELYFLEGDKMMAADVPASGPLAVGRPRQLFEQRFSTCVASTCYGVAPDGRFLMIQPIDPEQPTTQINIVLNWYDELKRLVPTK